MSTNLENLDQLFLKDTNVTSKAKITCHAGEAPFYIRYYSHSDQKYKLEEREIGCYDYHQLIFFFRGDWAMNVCGNTAFPRSGDLVIIRAGEERRGVAVSDTELEYLQIDIPVHAFDNIDSSHIFTDVFTKRPYGKSNFLSAVGTEYDSLIKTGRKIVSLLNETEPEEMLIYSYAIRFMYVVNEVFRHRSVVPEEVYISDKLFEAIKYIRSNVTLIMSLKDVAGHINVSVSYLCRMFKENLGYTPREYITDQKIEHAKMLMCTQNKNVSEACFESGFKDYTSFITIFKQKTGYTPLSYKKKFS